MRSHALLPWFLALLTSVTACDLKRSPTETGSQPLSGVVVSPDSVMLDPLQSYQFRAFGRGAAGDTVSVNANWSATAGSITSSGMYTADTSDNDAAVTASIPLSGVTLTGTSLVRKRRVIAIVLTPSSTSLPANTVMQFIARGIRNSGDTVAVNVNYSASGGTITAGGMFAAGTVPGTYRVIAADNPRRLADTSVVTVTTAPVAFVTLSPNPASLGVGGTAQLSATLTDLAGNVLTGRSITWSSNASGVATVSPSGLVSAVSAGNATITATSEGTDGTAAIIVSSALVPVASVTVSPNPAGVAVGGTVQLTAVAKDSAGNVLTGRSITWTSNSTGVATVSASGLVGGVSVGNATITATSEGKSGTAAVNVSLAPVASVTVSPNPAGVRVGGTVQLTAVIKDAAGNVLTGRVVTWASSVPAVATVSASGLVTGVAAGAITITATSEGKSGTAAVNVSLVPVASVTVSPNPAGTAVGGTVQLTAVTKDSAGNILAGRAITWASNAMGVATVSASGLVTGVSAGNAAITATSEGKSGTAAVSITGVPVASVTVTPNPAGVRVGGTVQLTAVTKDSAGTILTGRAIIWNSNVTGVATVSAAGRVTGVAAGSATITATSEGKSGTAAVTVTLAPVATVTVSPNPASVVIAGTVQLAATLKDSAGTTLTGRVVTWASSAPAVATVSANGLVSGLAVGTATITATSEAKSGSANLTVTVVASACAACRYVDPAGNDANAGTRTAPWRTIQHAADVANPGDTVVVNNGIYTGGAQIVTIARSGTAAAWIVFRAANRWGAIIDGQNNSSTTGFEINGNYIRVEGFEVRNTSRYAVETYGGREDIAGNHDVVVTQNHLHDVGHICTGTTGGIVGVSAYSDNLTIERNVIHDIGRLGPGEQGCVEPNPNWQNHDHGIYNGVGNNVVIRSNVFYNLTHGWAIQRYNGAGSVTTGLTIVNNTFGFPNPWRDAQIIIATATNNVVIANNVFYQPTTAGVWFDGAGNGATLVGNISTDAVQTLGTGLTMSGNMPNTDPLFVNATGFNFHLTAGSPARGLGVAAWCPSVDFDGVARSGACSAGAYQN